MTRKVSGARLEVRRKAPGELRVYVDGRPLDGVKSTTMECVGYGNTNVLIKISGKHIRLTDEEPVPAGD